MASGAPEQPVGPPETQPRDAHLNAIQAFLRAPQRQIVVGRLPAAATTALGAQTDGVLLSAETMEKQAAHHPDLSEDDYLQLPLVLADPTVMLAQVNRRVVLLRAGARILRAAVKTTADGRENYLVSLHAMDEAAVRRFLRARTLLLGRPKDLLR